MIACHECGIRRPVGPQSVAPWQSSEAEWFGRHASEDPGEAGTDMPDRSGVARVVGSGYYGPVRPREPGPTVQPYSFLGCPVRMPSNRRPGLRPAGRFAPAGPGQRKFHSNQER
jgi:hypothetical protein